jgi:thymidylate synthase
MRQYKELLQHILTHGTDHSDRTGVGTKSVFGYQNRYSLTPFPILTTKKIAFKSLTNELLWFLSGSCNNNRLVERKCTIWNEWSDLEHTKKFGRLIDDLGPIYSHQWRNFGADYHPSNREFPEDFIEKSNRFICPGFEDNGLDQIKWVVEEIQKNPNSRRLIVTGWNPHEQGSVTLPPCHTLFQFYVRDGKISCQLYQRSADSFLGVPFNISSYALLTCMVGHVCGLEPKDFVHTFGDLHIYNNHFPQVEEILNRECRPGTKLILNPALYNSGFEGLMKFKIEDVSLEGYDPHASIKAEVAV